MLIAASFALAGCATSSPTTSRTAHTPSPTPSAPAGYYADAAAKYAITFPGKPSVAPIAGTEAERATYSTEADPTTPTAVYFTSGGTITASAFTTTYEDLEGGLFQMINQGMKLTSGEKKFKLDGMPAVESDFTDPAGKPGAVLLAGKGHSFYQLIVRGGTSKEQQTFFDSFKLLG